MPYELFKSMTRHVAAVVLLTASSLSGAAEAPEPTSNELRAAARLELAGLYYTQHQYGLALQETNKALALNSRYVQAYNMLGLVQVELRHSTEAETAFKRALQLDGNDGDTRNNYGLYLCNKRDVKGAYEQFELAANNPLYGTPEKAFYNAGRCARTNTDSVTAKRYFTAALKAQPKATAVMFELGEMLLEISDYQSVLDVTDRMEAVEGATSQSLWLALRAERKLQHVNEATSYGTQLVNKFPDSAEALLYKVMAID